jgi:hypothetical protein
MVGGGWWMTSVRDGHNAHGAVGLRGSTWAPRRPGVTCAQPEDETTPQDFKTDIAVVMSRERV